MLKVKKTFLRNFIYPLRKLMRLNTGSSFYIYLIILTTVSMNQ